MIGLGFEPIPPMDPATFAIPIETHNGKPIASAPDANNPFSPKNGKSSDDCNDDNVEGATATTVLAQGDSALSHSIPGTSPSLSPTKVSAAKDLASLNTFIQDLIGNNINSVPPTQEERTDKETEVETREMQDQSGMIL